jgi:hypothetical protein
VISFILGAGFVFTYIFLIVMTWIGLAIAGVCGIIFFPFRRMWKDSRELRQFPMNQRWRKSRELIAQRRRR